MSFLLAVDLNWLVQFVFTVILLAVALLHFVKTTASSYFLAEDDHGSAGNVSDWSTTATVPFSTTSTCNTNHSEIMSTAMETESCAVCGSRTTKWCSGCKIVMYCSPACQSSHWRSEHKRECKDFQKLGKSIMRTRRNPSTGSSDVHGGSSKISNQILFPYEDFVELFNWEKPGFPPCGLLNCGNSCFANAVLQCLAYTKPLIAFLLERGHKRECRRNDWCFLCEFQNLIERANHSLHPFAPINILSRLPNIGGNLGYGRQEDAHEFMRFAIDTMQSVCLDEFGGEKFVHPSSQVTTLIQHIFGGHLQSQVICTKCRNVSNQFENMMDLTVEIQGDATSLEDCLDQFTAKEWLHGDNMYKCDGCNDYVLAWKRLTIRQAPNILTVALKRFQSGRFGKLNKTVSFPEKLNLSSYMSEAAEDDNIYKLYAVIVHMDMLNASFFGHYICYVKDFRGNWYRVDDCKVMCVDLDEVLSQRAYMLLYSRSSARRSCLYPVQTPRKEEQDHVEVKKEVELSSTDHDNGLLLGEPAGNLVDSVQDASETTSHSKVVASEVDSSSTNDCGPAKVDIETLDFKESCPLSLNDELCDVPVCVAMERAVHLGQHTHDPAPSIIPTTTPSLPEADTHKAIPSSPLHIVEDYSGGSKSVCQDFSVTHSSDENPMGSKNDLDLTEENPHDAAAVSSSGENPDQPRTVYPKDKSAAGQMSISGVPPLNPCEDVATLPGRKHRASKRKPAFIPGFRDRGCQALENHDNLKEGLPQDVSAAVYCCDKGREGKEFANCIGKSGAQAMQFSGGIPASSSSEHSRDFGQKFTEVAKPILRPGFLNNDSVVIENDIDVDVDVDVKEDWPLDVSEAPSSSEVGEVSQTLVSLDKTETGALGILSSTGVQLPNGFQDVARKSEEECFIPNVEPLIHPGLLEINSAAMQNNVDLKKELHCETSVVSVSGVTLEETRTVKSWDASGEAACGFVGGVSPSNGFQDEAKRSHKKRSANSAFRRGFL